MILSYVTSWLYQHLFVWNLPSITHTGPNGKTNMPSLPPKQKRLNDGATQFFWKQKMRMDGSSLCTESGILTSFLFVSSAGVFYSTIPEPVAAQKSHRWNPTKTKSTRKKTFVHPFPTSALVKAICKKIKHHYSPHTSILIDQHLIQIKVEPLLSTRLENCRTVKHIASGVKQNSETTKLQSSSWSISKSGVPSGRPGIWKFFKVIVFPFFLLAAAWVCSERIASSVS